MRDRSLAGRACIVTGGGQGLDPNASAAISKLRPTIEGAPFGK